MTAIKHDADKDRWDLLPIAATEQVVEVLMHGARVYGDHNWRKGLSYSRMIAACYRHLAAIQKCEDTDPDSGLLHASHLATEALFLTEHMVCELGKDDRWR